MFWNKNNDLIITKITKNTKEVMREKEIEEKIYKKLSTCPECGFKNCVNPFGSRSQNGTSSMRFGKCKRCDTEWTIKY